MTLRNVKTKKFFYCLLIVFVMLSIVLLPKPEKVSAGLGSGYVSDFHAPIISAASGKAAVEQTVETHLTIKQSLKEALKAIYKGIARRLLNQMTKSTLNWINSGFHGAPLFVENPKSFFRDIAKFEVRNFVDTIGYDPTRFPFGKANALNAIYTFKSNFETNAQYSLSRVINDPVYLNNYRNNFSFGGWEGFLINTQYPQNNAIGFSFLAQDELARRLEGTEMNAAQTVRNTLQQGLGFLSPETCPSNPSYNNLQNQFNRPEFNMAEYYRTHPPVENVYSCTENPTTREEINACNTWREDERTYQELLQNAKAEWSTKNSCPGGLVSTTPGSAVGAYVNRVLGDSSVGQVLTEIGAGDSVSAIVDALINQFLEKE